MLCGHPAAQTVSDPTLPFLQVSRRLLSRPQDALEGVVLSVSALVPGTESPTWDSPSTPAGRSSHGLTLPQARGAQSVPHHCGLVWTAQPGGPGARHRHSNKEHQEEQEPVSERSDVRATRDWQDTVCQGEDSRPGMRGTAGKGPPGSQGEDSQPGMRGKVGKGPPCSQGESSQLGR